MMNPQSTSVNVLQPLFTSEILAKILAQVPFSVGPMQQTCTAFYQVMKSNDWFEILVYLLRFPRTTKGERDFRNVFKEFLNFHFNTAINTDLTSDGSVCAKYPTPWRFQTYYCQAAVSVQDAQRKINEAIAENDRLLEEAAAQGHGEATHARAAAVLEKYQRQIEHLLSLASQCDREPNKEKMQEMALKNGLTSNLLTLQLTTPQLKGQLVQELEFQLQKKKLNYAERDEPYYEYIGGDIVFEESDLCGFFEMPVDLEDFLVASVFVYFLSLVNFQFHPPLEQSDEQHFLDIPLMCKRARIFKLCEMAWKAQLLPMPLFLDELDPLEKQKHELMKNKLLDFLSFCSFQDSVAFSYAYHETEGFVSEMQVTHFTEELVHLKTRSHRLSREYDYLNSCRSQRQYNDITVAIIGCPLRTDLEFRLYVELNQIAKGSECYFGISAKDHLNVAKVTCGSIICMPSTWCITDGRRHHIQLNGKEWNDKAFYKFQVGDTVGMFLDFSASNHLLTFYVNNIQQGPVFSLELDDIGSEIEIFTYGDTASDDIEITEVVWGDKPEKLKCQYDWQLTNGAESWYTINMLGSQGLL